MPVLCTTCDQFFKTYINFKAYIFVHSGKKPFKCDHCPYACTGPDKLKMHAKIHTKENPYQCKYCDRSFSQNL